MSMCANHSRRNYASVIYKIGVKSKVITFGEFIKRLIAAAH